MDQASVNVEAATPQTPVADQKPSDKELNFRRLEQALEQERAEKEREREEKSQLMQKLQQLESSDDDLDEDGYVEAKKLRKVFSRFEQKLEQKIEKKAEERARRILEEDNQKNFGFRVKAEMPDFDQVVTDDAANKFAEKFPEWANTILSEPDNYKKRKLTYEAIKGLNFNKKAEASVQEKVNNNLKNPYLQPATVAPGMTQLGGDFSKTGQKAAYERVMASKGGFK